MWRHGAEKRNAWTENLRVRERLIDADVNGRVLKNLSWGGVERVDLSQNTDKRLTRLTVELNIKGSLRTGKFWAS
jgi:hypothetical protein